MSTCWFCLSAKISYVDRDGDIHNVRGKVGDNAMYLAHRYDIEMEGTTYKHMLHVFVIKFHLFYDRNVMSQSIISYSVGTDA